MSLEHALYCDAHVPDSADTSQLEHVAVGVEQTPELHVPPSQEFPHEPQSVLDVFRFWQPSEQ